MWEGVRYCIYGDLEDGFWQGLDGIGPDFSLSSLKALNNLDLLDEAGAVLV